MDKRYHILLSCLLLLLGLSDLTAQTCEKLIWSDEFDGAMLDSTKWNYDIGNGCPELCGWGNNEQEYYTNSTDNVSVNNGLLTITAKPDTIGGMAYSSGRITTINKGDFRYGRIEASIRLPETQGLWPAFWLLPTDKKYGEWPRSGEIDILELVGHKENEVFGTLHTGLPWTFLSGTYALPMGESFADTFHTFSIEWNPDTISWFVDGIMYHQLTPDSISPWAPFQEDFHLILNIAVGGNLPGSPDSTSVFPQVMEIDYVRVYNRPERLMIRGEQPTIGASAMSYHTFDIQGANYVWSVPADAMITSGQGSSEITVDWGCTAGDITLELQTDCDTAMITYSVSNFIDGEIEGLNTVIENQAGLTFSIPAVGGGTYTWSVPSDANIISGQGTNEILVDWGCTSGDVILMANGTCASAINDTIAVNLEEYSISGFATVSLNSTGKVYSIDPVPGATFNWSVPSDASIVSGQGTNEIIVDFGMNEGDVSVDVTTTCGTQTYLVSITIDPSSIYCDFDFTDLNWEVFGGAFFEKVNNPSPDSMNPSNLVGKSRKDPGAQNWGGIFADLAGEMDLPSNPLINVKVYSPRSGIVKVKLEDLNTAVAPFELDITHDSSDQWMNLVWDFTGQPANTFERLTLFFDFGQTDTSFWYFDDVIGKSDANTNIDEVAISPIKVYPNPSSGAFSVELGDDFTNDPNVKVQITDANGKLIYQSIESMSRKKFQVDLGRFPQGVYFMKIVTSNTRYIKAIMKAN